MKKQIIVKQSEFVSTMTVNPPSYENVTTTDSNGISGTQIKIKK